MQKDNAVIESSGSKLCSRTGADPGLTAKVSTDPGHRGEWRLKSEQTLRSTELHMELVFGTAQVVTRLVGAGAVDSCRLSLTSR